MTLEELNTAVEDAYDDLEDDVSVDLDEEARHELAMLVAALDDDADDLIERAVHTLFQATVDTAKLDFHLRSGYGCTYDEFLSGMTFDDMAAGGEQFAAPDDDRRYQF